jgi:class 3 adenylate cyclase/tetratricopeptide (TPR) repeat protein
MAAVLFTDLVGSTDLMSRLGGPVFDELRRTHFAALSRAITRSGGDEIKNTGDGIMASFRSVVDAIHCAVAMQQATDRQSRSAPAPLSTRVGLSIGEVTFEDGDLFGTPVVEAARLVAVAEAGQILTTAIVRTLAAGRLDVGFRDLGPLDLKGLPEPVAACEVLWDPLPGPSLPMPALLIDVGRIFVGRDQELERLGQLWKESAAGERRVALLAGEPGVGKTRLAAELARQVHAEGAAVLAGRCDEDLGVPYQPFVEALHHFIDHVPAEDLAGRLGRYGGELSRLVPELADRMAPLPPPLRSDPETERYRLFDAVAAWLAAASADAPLLLLLDDLQWAAKPTLLLLRHVVRSPESHRVLVLGTYRDTELGHDHPLVEVMADLRRQEGVQRLSLLGLDSSGVAAYMEQAAGHDLDEADLHLARAIHEETEGNPFFVREVLRHLTETGAIERREGRWAARLPVEELGIPEGVREVVGRRLSHLSKEANRVLRVAAVVGPQFELSVLQESEGVDEDDLVAALEEAAEAGLLMEAGGVAGRYRFAHALVRDTIYYGVSAARRVSLHRRVAEAIETVHAAHLDGQVSALAHHYARAAAPAAETAKAVAYARRAGDRALAQLAPDEAAGWYLQALELLDASSNPPDEGERCEVLISLGEAQRHAGDPRHRDTLLDAAAKAEALEDAVLLARAALANNRGFFSVSEAVDNERVAVLEAALQRLGAGDSPLRARLLVTLAAELTFSPDHQHRHRLVTDALALARRLDDPATLGHVLSTSYVPALGQLDVAALQRNTAELAEVAERLADPGLSFWSREWRFLTAVLTGDFPAGDGFLDAAAALAQDLGQASMRWVATFERSHRCRMTGRLEEAETLAGQAFERGQAAGLPDAFLIFNAQLFWLRYDQGRLEELLDLFARAAARPDASPFTRALHCVALCELDRPEAARAEFEELAAGDFAALPVHYAWLYGMTLVAEVCAHLSDRERAGALHQRLAPHHALVATLGAVSSGPVAHFLGLLAATLGHHDEAESHFGQAAAISESVGAPAWLARTRVAWARLLVGAGQSGDTERVRDLLDRALATARELGLGTVERRAVALLQQA